MIYSWRNVDIRAFRQRISVLAMIGDNSLKTRVIASKLVSIDRIRWTLQGEHKNMCVSLRNNDLFSKKRFSCISQTEHDILGMTDENFLKTRVTASTLVWIVRIRWTLQADRKDMCVPVWNNDLFSKKLRFSCFSPSEQDILGMIDDNALITRVIPLKLDWIDRIYWT